MAISEINRAMSAMAQPTEFDQSAWKKAFDISNAFNTASNNAINYADNALKHNENLATSDWRTAYKNNGYEQGIKQNGLKTADLQRLYSNALKTDPSLIQATIAQNNFATTGSTIANKEALGQEQLMGLLHQHGFNTDGTAKTLPETWQAMQSAGVDMNNPYVASHFWKAGNQQRQNVQGVLDNVLRNSFGTVTDPLGNVVSTGQIDQNKLGQQLNLAIATGQISQEQADGLIRQLYPKTPNTTSATALPTPMSFVPAIGGFSSQLANLTPENTQTIPYAIGYTPPPFMLQYGAETMPSMPQGEVNDAVQPVPTTALPVEAPLTQAEKEQITLQHLKNWESGGASQYWQNFWAEKKARDLAQAEALEKAIEARKSFYGNGYPLFR